VPAGGVVQAISNTDPPPLHHRQAAETKPLPATWRPLFIVGMRATSRDHGVVR
jgi:hypothetical protein